LDRSPFSFPPNQPFIVGSGRRPSTLFLLYTQESDVDRHDRYRAKISWMLSKLDFVRFAVDISAASD